MQVCVLFSAVQQAKSSLLHGTEKFAERSKNEASIVAKRDAARWRFETDGQTISSLSASEAKKSLSIRTESVSSNPVYGYKSSRQDKRNIEASQAKSWKLYYDNEAFAGPHVKKELPEAERQYFTVERQRRMVTIKTCLVEI